MTTRYAAEQTPPKVVLISLDGAKPDVIERLLDPIGGYRISLLGPSPGPTAQPLWIQSREAGRRVVTATWPGGDGLDVRISGTVVQSAIPTQTALLSCLGTAARLRRDWFLHHKN